MAMYWQRISIFLLFSAAVSAESGLMDPSGALRMQSIPNVPSAGGIVTVITSPGTPSLLSEETSEVLSLRSQDPPILLCRGATLSGTSDAERTSLATCSLAAGAIVLDGITAGDVEAGLRDSRHSRTLTALFRARVKLEHVQGQRQMLILAIYGDDSSIDEGQMVNDIKGLYKAAAVEKKNSASFEDMYDLQIVSVNSSSDADKVMSVATEAAKAAQTGSEILSSSLSNAYNLVRESGVGAIALDTPHIAHSFVAVGYSYGRQSRAARAKIASWRSRAARGLLIDNFGREAEALRKRILQTFEKETLSAAGLPLVALYRLEERGKLQTLVDTAIEEIFAAQVANLEKGTLKRFQSQLLRTMNDPTESIMDSNAAALRKETFTFETIMEDLEIPALGLTKEKAAREMASKLNDALMSFPDSPAAKVQRTKQVKKVVSKEKKPGQLGIDLGLDLVAMLRPDGFGSLQGFAGYQFGGNSLTFGVHNDADDPQVIAQFGGVRPPLLRVQPKLRIDVEM